MEIGLTLFSFSRRPVGQPIEEEIETEAPTSEAPAEREQDDREDRPAHWAYDGIEEDNDVWGR